MEKAQINLHIEIDKKKLLNFIKRNADKMAFGINSELAKRQLKVAREISNNAVDAFYNDYSPNSYVRKYNLYNAADYGISNGDDFIFEIGYELMRDAKYHQPTKYVYDITFEQGYHGGINWFAPPFHKGQKPVMEAPKMDPSPYDLIVNQWNDYLDNEYEKEKKEIVNNVCKKFVGKYRN